MNTAAYLKAQGWRGEGFSLDHTNRGIARPLLVDHKKDLAGLGNKKNDFGNQWWLNAFDKSLSSLGSTPLGSPGPQSAHPKKSGLYARFVKAETMGGTRGELKSTDAVSTPAARTGVEGKKRKLDDALDAQPTPEKRLKKDKSEREKKSKIKHKKDKGLEVPGREGISVTEESKSKKTKAVDVDGDPEKVKGKKKKKKTRKEKSTKTEEDELEENKKEKPEDYADRKAEKAKRKRDGAARRTTESSMGMNSMPRAPQSPLEPVVSAVAPPAEAYINPARLAMMDPQVTRVQSAPRPAVSRKTNVSSVFAESKPERSPSEVLASMPSMVGNAQALNPVEKIHAAVNGTHATNGAFITPARLAIMDPLALKAPSATAVPVKENASLDNLPLKPTIPLSKGGTEHPRSKAKQKAQLKRHHAISAKQSSVKDGI